MFRPCEDEKTGVNVWIALSPMTATQGGGLAITPGSHKVNFAQKAIETIRKGGTCFMETLAPDIHDKLEAMKVVYDMEPGDAIIHDRYLFHRSDSFHEDVDVNLTLNRYSIRYMPEDALSYDHSGQPLKNFDDKFPQVFPQVENIEGQL
jgi:ectoine hydroxylase-related dioxygenase (phytanoyl-CoA dioxygenase family)